MIETDGPKVFVVAETRMNAGEVEDFLREIGADNFPIGRSRAEFATGGAEELTELMGRLCYRSFEPGMNPNVTAVREDPAAYLANLMRSGHGSPLEHSSVSLIFHNVSRVFCYDGATEVLTSEGWKRWPEVTGHETFATLNPETGVLEYQKASEYFSGHHEGLMYRVQSEQVDLLVTPQHRMWVRRHDTQKAKRGEEPFGIYHAQDIQGKRVHYQKTAKWVGQEDGDVLIEGAVRSWNRRDTGTTVTRNYSGVRFALKPFARFLGWFLAEGSINGHQICIAQNRGPGLEEIRCVVEDMGLPAYIPDTGGGCVRTQCTPLRDMLKDCGGSAHTKRVPSFVQEWGPSAIREFLEAYVKGDGSQRVDGGHSVIYTASPGMADDLQILAIKAGWSANVRVDDRVGMERTMKSGQVFYNKNPSYIVSLVKTRTFPLVNHNGATNDEMVPFSGRVYCVKVPNGLLFVRRNGKPVVSGNTHELVRHRVGCAYSQESLRYVRLDSIKFWFPPSIQGEESEWVRDAFRVVVERIESEINSLIGEFDMDGGMNFARKKKLTSLFRRIAPLGLSTTIGATFNHRALRHLIAMRTAEGAEEEIRLVFDMVARIALRHWPMLYSDFETREVDGINEWKPQWAKI
jgi:thymidylate synthase ThyX